MQNLMIRDPFLSTPPDWVADARHEDFPRIGDKVRSSDGIPGIIMFAYADGSFDARYDFPSGAQVSIRYGAEDYQRMLTT